MVHAKTGSIIFWEATGSYYLVTEEGEINKSLSDSPNCGRGVHNHDRISCYLTAITNKIVSKIME